MCSLGAGAQDGATSPQLKMSEAKIDNTEGQPVLPPRSASAASGSSSPPNEAAAVNPPTKSASLSFLAKVKLFKRLPKDQHSLLQQICVPLDFPSGHVLIKQGDSGNEFYVIVTGKVSVTIDASKVADLGVGDYFGEIALLRAEPRNATITATTKLSVLKITREKFQESGLLDKLEFAKRAAVGGGADAPVATKAPSPKTAQDRATIMNALKTNKNLSGMVELDDAKCNAMSDVAWEETVPSGKAVITQGSDQADYFYIVKEGSFEIFVSKPPDEGQSPQDVMKSQGEMVGTITQGGSFGELALIYFAPRAATVKASTASILWVIDRANFKKVLAKGSEGLVKQVLGYIEKFPFFKELKADEKMEIAKAMSEMDFSKGESIYEQGELASSMHFLVDGEASVVKDGKESKVKGTKDCVELFGESGLLDDSKRGETVKVISNTAQTFTIDRQSFELLLGPLAEIKKRGAAGESKVGKGKKAPKKKLDAQKKQILRKDLKKIGLLGCGGFGAVDLVEHTTTKDSFALKSLSKGHVVKCRMQASVVAEKTIQYMCDSPFIVKLYECYNEPQNLCFLLELALGGELYDTYCKKGFHGSLKHAQYYVGGTTFGFEHLHEKKIVYRDLKPENLLLVEGGKIKLTDMGLAKVVVGKTNTTCGTPDYFAPEVIGSVGHNHAVDWYTLGILLFEFMTGNPPFESANPQQTMGKIQKGINTVKFPPKLKGDGEDLVKKLCNKNPSERLPMKKDGIENIMKHPWYTGFSWAAMRDGTMDGPYKPEIKSKTDLKNFSANAADKPPQIPYKDDGSGWDKDFATSN